MTTFVRIAALGTVLAAGLVAIAQPLWAGGSKAIAEGQAVTTELGGSAKAVTYWNDRPEGALVVTTVDTVSASDTDAEQHAVVRLETLLQPGQVQEISVPMALGAQQPVLRIERISDEISVSIVNR
jgi:hypothetical protein